MNLALVLPDALRMALFCGLALHKVIWEVWKSRSNPAAATGKPPSIVKRAVKAAKAGVLICLLIQTLFVSVFPILARPGPLRATGMLLYLIGLATAIAGRVALGQSWSNIEDGVVGEEHALVTGGVYRYIRHPIYAGDALLLIGLELALNSWLALAMLVPAAVFARQALAEEARLAQAVPEYERYRQRTKRFMPFLL